MWTLTLVIYIGLTVYTAATSTTVTGFKSRSLCEEAAKQITSQLKRGDAEGVCVFIGGGKPATATAPPVAAAPPVPAPSADPVSR